MDNGMLKRLYGMDEDEYEVLTERWNQILEDIDMEEQGDPHEWEPTEEELTNMMEAIKASNMKGE